MKVIVAHEGKQHSFMTAQALYKEGLLHRYITTVYDKPFSFTRLTNIFLRGNLKKRGAGRKMNIPNNMVKQYCELGELFVLFLIRFPKIRQRFFPRYWRNLQDRFSRKVAEYAIKENVDAVIMYDTTCNECWKVLKERAPHIKRIMDISIANRYYLREIYSNDIKATGINEIRDEQYLLWDEDNMRIIKDEIENTQYFLAGSTMVKKSLMFSGVKEEHIAVVHYGTDVNKFKFTKRIPSSGPLKLIFVGQINYRKGMHHLLKVVSEFSADEVILDLAGSYSPDNVFYQQYKDCGNIKFLGYVTRDILAEKYQNADVFVLASLGEGCALVGLEALSCGLPCILSDMTGCNDFIEDGQNGKVFHAGNDEQLKEFIRWFIANKELLPEMSKKSRETALSHSWEQYNTDLVSSIINFMSAQNNV